MSPLRRSGNGRGRTPPLRRVQEVRGERNPPVTALPCQPPLGKGAEGTGDADCHSQCAHWLRNDRVFARGAVGGGLRDARPTEGLQEVRKNGRGRTPPLRRAYKECGERADVGIGPYESAARSSVNGPPGICRRGPSFGFLGKKIPASKAGSILPYYGGGDNARKNFARGEILSHTMIFF